MTGKIILIAFCLSLLHREAFQNKCAKIVARKFRQAMTTNSKQAKGKSLLPPPPPPPPFQQPLSAMKQDRNTVAEGVAVTTAIL